MLNQLKKKKLLNSLTKFFGNEENVDEGLRLEDEYREQLSKKLKGVDEEDRKSLIDRIVGKEGSEDLRTKALGGLAKKPVLEELKKIPLNDQLKMMGEHFKTLKNTREETKEEAKKRRLNTLLKGQRLS